MRDDRDVVPIVPIVPANEPDALWIADKVWMGLSLTDEDQRAIDDAAGIDADWDTTSGQDIEYLLNPGEPSWDW